MLKRFTVILIAFSLFIPQLALAGYGEPKDWKLFVNGEEKEVEAFAEITDFAQETRFKYVPLAQIAGYETSFDAERSRVTSTKGNDSISFVLDSFEAEVTKNGTTQTVPLTWSVIEQNGSTYMDYTDMETLLGLRTIRNKYWTNQPILYVYNVEQLANDILPDTTSFVSYIDESPLPPTAFSCKTEWTGTFDMDYGLIGLQLKGDIKLNSEIKRQDDLFEINAELSGNGLYNLIRIILQNSYYSDAEDLINLFDLDSSIKFNLFMDSNAIYVQSDQLTPLLIFKDSYYPSSLGGKDDITKQLQGKWLKYEFIDSNRAQWQDFMNHLNTKTSGEDVLKMLINQIIDNHVYADNEDTMKKISLLGQLVSDDYFKTQQNSFNLEFDHKALDKMLNTAGWWVPSDNDTPWKKTQKETAKKYFDRSDFDYSLSEATENDITTAQFDMAYQLKDMVEFGKMRFGNISVDLSGESTLTPGEQQLQAPSDDTCVIYSELLSSIAELRRSAYNNNPNIVKVN